MPSRLIHFDIIFSCSGRRWMGVIGFIGRRLDRRCEYSAVGVIREIERGNLGGFTPILTCVEVWDA